MKNPHRLAALLLILPFLWVAAFPRTGRAAEDATDAIEKELLSVLQEMDTLSSELARIEEIVAIPKATSLRIEIRRAGNVPAPASSKVYLSGKVDAERDWSREEKARFLSGDTAGAQQVWHECLLARPKNARVEAYLSMLERAAE